MQQIFDQRRGGLRRQAFVFTILKPADAVSLGAQFAVKQCFHKSFCDGYRNRTPTD
jgi:hypothetical protein